MWLDNHPYIFIYLLGCSLVIILTFVKLVLFYAIDWVTKGTILKKNLKKLMPPDEKSILRKTVAFLGIVAIETLLSWINVFVILWQIIAGLFRILRELLTPVPEAVKALRFPLRNNPSMARESVWAYLLALAVKAGEKQPNENQLIDKLDEVCENCPSFDRIDALKQLESLGAISPNTILSTISLIKASPSHDGGEDDL
jgi:hypothetical protein